MDIVLRAVNRGSTVSFAGRTKPFNRGILRRSYSVLTAGYD